MRRLVLVPIRLALLLLIALAPRFVAAQPASEYEVKAVFLYNFAQFVQWPAQAFPGSATPFVIGVLGEDPFGRHLDEVVAGERIGDRALAVRRFRTTAEIDFCHVLFISRSEATRLEDIFAALAQRPILTVGDDERFASRGGMIRLVMEDSKVRMRINPERARAAGLTISSKLLRPATIVGGEGN